MGFLVTWRDRNVAEEGHNVYRSDAPMDPQNLPAPIASVGPDITEWEDGTVVPGNTYYYRVGALTASGGVEMVSDEFEAVAEEVIVTAGLVLHLDAADPASYPGSGTDWFDLSDSANHGVMQNGATFDTAGGGCIAFDGTDDRVVIANSASLQLTGNQTLEFWVYPERRDIRQNWYNKAYGGEGTITYETSGSLNYYYGTSGSNSLPYQSFNTGEPVMETLNRWYHVVVVRDLVDLELRWYLDGVLVATTEAEYASATTSNDPLLLGDGYTDSFRGRLAVVRQYDRALPAAVVDNNYRVGAARFGHA